MHVQLYIISVQSLSIKPCPPQSINYINVVLKCLLLTSAIKVCAL